MKRDKGKHRFTCYKCGQLAWGKLTAKVICGVCRLPMMPDEKKETAG
jgi:hypothetical protein